MSSQEIRVQETENRAPICPHCERHLSNINATKLKSSLGVRFVYFCSFCSKVLGVSHRKGFWMG